MSLPTPRMSATITPPTRRGDVGRVEVHEPGRRAARTAPDPARVDHAWHRCSRCDAAGHNAKNKRCPAREAG